MIKHIQMLLATLALVMLPIGVGAMSSTSYQMDPSENTISIRHSLTSTSYQIDGSLEPLTGNNTSTSYTIETGGNFKTYCGDGFVDPGESCDRGNYGINMNGKTCVSEGYASGTLTCTSACAFDTASCILAGGGGGGGGGGGTTVTSTTPNSPTVDSSFTITGFYTYQNSLLIFGTIDSNSKTVEINGSTTGVTINNSTWQATVALSDGNNTFKIVAKNSSGTASSATSLTIYERKMADINDDKKVDDYDLSKLIQLWLTNKGDGDFNADGVVDDYDFSILVSHWS